MIPEISVLVPVGQGVATYLEEALASLRAQQEVAFEVVLVDDDAGESSCTLLDRFRRADPRFRVVASRGRGIVEALNTGLAEVRAPLTGGSASC